jgi:hypothetical protein
MRLPIIPLIASATPAHGARRWYYDQPAEEQRRMADLRATVFGHRTFDKALHQLTAIEARIVLTCDALQQIDHPRRGRRRSLCRDRGGFSGLRLSAACPGRRLSRALCGGHGPGPESQARGASH